MVRNILSVIGESFDLIDRAIASLAQNLLDFETGLLHEEVFKSRVRTCADRLLLSACGKEGQRGSVRMKSGGGGGKGRRGWGQG